MFEVDILAMMLKTTIIGKNLCYSNIRFILKLEKIMKLSVLMVLVVLAVAAFATRVKLRDTHSAIVADGIEQINKLDWKTIDTLIDRKETILDDKRVTVDGKEVNKDFAFKLIGYLSIIDWEHLHYLVDTHKSNVVGEILRRKKTPLIVTDALLRTQRMIEVDWNNYFKSFGNYQKTFYINRC